MITKLKKEQEKKLSVYRNKYIDAILNNSDEININELIKYIHWFYDKFNIGNKKPIVILLDSPLEVYIAISIFSQVGDQVRDQVWDQVWAQVGAQVWAQVEDQVWAQVRDQARAQVRDQVRDQVWAQVGAQVGAQVENQVRDQVGDQVWDQVGDQVWAQVGAQVRAQVGDQVWAQVRAQVGELKIDYFSPTPYLSRYDVGWISFYDFFDKECFELEISDLFNKYKELININFGYCVAFENIVFVTKNAEYYKRDVNGRLHNVYGPAYKFGNYKYYSIRGVSISEKLFVSLENKTYTFEDWVKESNEEIKSAVLAYFEEKYGSESLFRFISDNLKEIDTYTDQKEEIYLSKTTKGMNIGVYTLYKGNINNIDLSFVRCYCPSTDRMFFLSTESKFNNAKDAIASLYRIPQKLVNHIKYIQRQGERFSTVFTDEGNKILEKMTDEDVKNLISISGNKYFELMKYEY